MTDPLPPPAEPAPEPDAAAAEVSAADDAVQAVLDLDLQDRQLLRVMQPVLCDLRGLLEPEQTCDPVHIAAREALIAICDRVGRICRRDLPAD